MCMNKKFNLFRIVLMVIIITLISSEVVLALPSITTDGDEYLRGDNINPKDVVQTKVSQYALSWDGNVNLPYVWGGKGGRSITLEKAEENPVLVSYPIDPAPEWKNWGTDCSGFTSGVYAYYGISIPAQSEEQKNSAVKTFTDIEEAVPGDICWWEGHVAIYIGNGRIIHTSTSKTQYYYPHVSTIHGEGINFKYPELFLRMVDDISKLGILTGSSAEKVDEKVKSAKSIASYITESDLTGLELEESLMVGYEGIPEIPELSDRDKVVLGVIQDNMLANKLTLYDLVRIIVSFLGLCTIIYGLLLGVAYLFDRTNNIFEVSLLGVVTLGKYRLWDETMGVSRGKCSDGYVYCDFKYIISRIVIVEVVGFFLVSGFIFNIVAKILLFILDKL